MSVVAWESTVAEALAAARNAGEVLTSAAARCCPRPESEGDTSALLHFRGRCGLSPFAYPFRMLGRFRPENGEPDTAQRLSRGTGIDPASLRGPLEALLEAIERLLDQRAREGDTALISTTGIGCIVETTESATVEPDVLCPLDALAAGHPIRALVNDFPEASWRGQGVPAVVLGPACRQAESWVSRDWYSLRYASALTEQEHAREQKRRAVQGEIARQDAAAIERDRQREAARRADSQATIAELEKRIAQIGRH